MNRDLKDDKSLQELRLSDNNMSTLSTELLVFAGLLKPSLQVFQLDGNPLRRCSYAVTKLALFKEKAHEVMKNLYEIMVKRGSPSGAHVSPFGVELPFHDVISKPDSIEFGLINPYSCGANPDYNPSSPQYRPSHSFYKTIISMTMGDNETVGAQTSDVQDNPSTVTDAMNVGCHIVQTHIEVFADIVNDLPVMDTFRGSRWLELKKKGNRPPPPPPPSSSQTPTQQTPHTTIQSRKLHKKEVTQNGNGHVSNSEGLHKGYNRFQRLLSQLEIHGAGVSTKDANKKFLRSLPCAWSQVSLITRTKPGVDSLSFDDLTNDVSTSYSVSNTSGQNSQYEQTSSHSLLANQSSCPQMDHEDLEQLDEFDLEEMGLKWQVVMISMRMKKFYKKTGRKLQFDAKELVGFDKTKVECYNCHKTGHFARECKTKGNQDSRRRDAWNSGNKDGRRSEAQKEKEDLKAKVEKWHKSSKNLGKLLNTQMSANDKFRLGYGDHRYDGILSYENEVLKSVFLNKESELEKQPLYDWFVIAGGMHIVPPPMTGNYMPSGPDVEIDYSQFTYGPNQSQPSESKTQTSDIDTCESDCSVETHESLLEPTVNEPKVVNEPKSMSDAPITEEYESDNEDEHIRESGNKHAGPQEANHNAGTKDNIDAGDSEKEDEFAQDYFVLYIWSSYSSTVKRSTEKDVDEAPNKHPDLKTDEKPVDKENQVFLDEHERLKRQENDAIDAAETLRNEFAQETKDLLLQAGAAKASSTNTVNTVSTPDIYKNPTYGIFTNSSYDDEGAVADFTNLETVVNVSPIPTSRINSIHPSTLILGDPQSAIQTRSKVSKSSGAHAFVYLEFKNRDFIELCGSKGIKREYSNAKTSQQNGVAKRKNKTLIEAARTMLANSFLPNTFWAEAVCTACYVFNRVIVTKPHNKTPYELVTGTKDNIDVGDSEKEDEFAQDYFVLPIWSSYSSTEKDADEAPNKHTDLKTNEKLVDKEDQVFLDELERLKRQEKDAIDAAETLRKEFA
ncbi:ribonuclease H-like domain-containing protein [Tanacetum coccineum]